MKAIERNVSPAGRARISAPVSSIAELESDLIRERIRAGMRRRKLDGLPCGRQPLDVDHESLVQDRLRGMSLTNVARKYSVSRASVVRFVRLARERESGVLKPRQLEVQEAAARAA